MREYYIKEIINYRAEMGISDKSYNEYLKTLDEKELERIHEHYYRITVMQVDN